MNSAVKSTFIFAIGAAIGSVVTWKLLSDVYERRLQEEIADIKDVYSKQEETPEEGLDTADEQPQENHKSEKRSGGIYETMVKRLGYTDYSSMSDTEEKKDDEIQAPHVISYEEFGNLEDYTCVGLTLHSDDILSNERSEVIEDVGDLLGDVSLDRDEFMDDALYVRNHKLKIDFEILLDEETYEQLLERKPYLKED